MGEGNSFSLYVSPQGGGGGRGGTWPGPAGGGGGGGVWMEGRGVPGQVQPGGEGGGGYLARSSPGGRGVPGQVQPGGEGGYLARSGQGGREGGGVPGRGGGGGTWPEGVFAMQRAVCLLRSRRRTFLCMNRFLRDIHQFVCKEKKLCSSCNCDSIQVEEISIKDVTSAGTSFYKGGCLINHLLQCIHLSVWTFLLGCLEIPFISRIIKGAIEFQMTKISVVTCSCSWLYLP